VESPSASRVPETSAGDMNYMMLRDCGSNVGVRGEVQKLKRADNELHMRTVYSFVRPGGGNASRLSQQDM
jgi:hypothetical protein